MLQPREIYFHASLFRSLTNFWIRTICGVWRKLRTKLNGNRRGKNRKSDLEWNFDQNFDPRDIQYIFYCLQKCLSSCIFKMLRVAYKTLRNLYVCTLCLLYKVFEIFEWFNRKWVIWKWKSGQKCTYLLSCALEIQTFLSRKQGGFTRKRNPHAHNLIYPCFFICDACFVQIIPRN